MTCALVLALCQQTRSLGWLIILRRRVGISVRVLGTVSFEHKYEVYVFGCTRVDGSVMEQLPYSSPCAP